MFNSLPETGPKVFGDTGLIAHRIAQKLQNSVMLGISFHSLKHWRTKVEYHHTSNSLHVKEVLGHMQLNSAMVYAHLVWFECSDYHVQTAKTLKGVCVLDSWKVFWIH